MSKQEDFYEKDLNAELELIRKMNSFYFYVSSSNKDLLRHVNYILQQKGYIVYQDDEDRLHYLIDGSENLYAAVDNMMAIVSDTDSINYRSNNKRKIYLQNKAIKDILDKYKIPRELKAYPYLRTIFKKMLREEQDKATPDKYIYQEVARQFHTGRTQLDRVLDYCFKKLGLEGTNSQIISEMIADLREYYFKLLL